MFGELGKNRESKSQLFSYRRRNVKEQKDDTTKENLKKKSKGVEYISTKGEFGCQSNFARKPDTNFDAKKRLINEMNTFDS